MLCCAEPTIRLAQAIRDPRKSRRVHWAVPSPPCGELLSGAEAEAPSRRATRSPSPHPASRRALADVGHYHAIRRYKVAKRCAPGESAARWHGGPVARRPGGTAVRTALALP